MQTVIRINERGAARVLNGTAGMTFVVERFSPGVAGEVAHVLDYRYPREDAVGGYQSWSIAADGYERLELDYGITFEEPEADDAAIDRWHDGWFDGHRAKPKASDDADYLKGYDEGHDARKVVVVMPARPEGYYHMPLGTFD